MPKIKIPNENELCCLISPQPVGNPQSSRPYSIISIARWTTITYQLKRPWTGQNGPKWRRGSMTLFFQKDLSPPDLKGWARTGKTGKKRRLYLHRNLKSILKLCLKLHSRFYGPFRVILLGIFASFGDTGTELSMYDGAYSTQS